jgi:hypothetical protein
MNGHRKKSIGPPALAENGFVSGGALAEVLIGQSLRAQLANGAEFLAVLLFAVPKKNNAGGMGLRRLGPESACERGESGDHDRKPHAFLPFTGPRAPRSASAPINAVQASAMARFIPAQAQPPGASQAMGPAPAVSPPFAGEAINDRS